MATCKQLQNDYDRDTNILDTTNPESSEYQEALNDLLTRVAPALVAQNCVPISLPSGTWQFDGNGFHGQLSLSLSGTFVLSVGLVVVVSETANIDAGFSDLITNGTWNEDLQQLSFERQLIRPTQTFTQQYLGYLFANPFGTEPPTVAGTFTDSTQNRSFGWYMHQ